MCFADSQILREISHSDSHSHEVSAKPPSVVLYLDGKAGLWGSECLGIGSLHVQPVVKAFESVIHIIHNTDIHPLPGWRRA